mgnify:CR=1 FL=1
MEAVLAGAGTLAVVFGYMIIKKIAKSRCAVDSGCLTCESPAVEMAKQHTERLDSLFEMVKKLEPHPVPASPESLQSPGISGMCSTSSGRRSIEC